MSQAICSSGSFMFAVGTTTFPAAWAQNLCNTIDAHPFPLIPLFRHQLSFLRFLDISPPLRRETSPSFRFFLPHAGQWPWSPAPVSCPLGTGDGSAQGHMSQAAVCGASQRVQFVIRGQRWQWVCNVGPQTHHVVWGPFPSLASLSPSSRSKTLFILHLSPYIFFCSLPWMKPTLLKETLESLHNPLHPASPTRRPSLLGPTTPAAFKPASSSALLRVHAEPLFPSRPVSEP